MKASRIGKGIGVVEPVFHSVMIAGGKDVVPCLKGKFVAEDERTVAVVLVAVYAGEVGGEGEAAVSAGQSAAEQSGIVLPVCHVVCHPAIEAEHCLYAQEAVAGRLYKVFSKGKVNPVGGGIGKAGIAEAVAAGGFEAETDNGVRQCAVSFKKLEERGDDDVAFVGNRALRICGMAFIAGFRRQRIVFLVDKADFRACPPLDEGVEETPGQVACPVSRIIMIFAPHFRLYPTPDPAAVQIRHREGIRAEIAGRIDKQCHIIPPTLRSDRQSSRRQQNRSQSGYPPHEYFPLHFEAQK